jgi:hypothetical protein
MTRCVAATFLRTVPARPVCGITNVKSWKATQIGHSFSPPNATGEAEAKREPFLQSDKNEAHTFFFRRLYDETHPVHSSLIHCQLHGSIVRAGNHEQHGD